MEHSTHNPTQRFKVIFVVSSFGLGGKEQMLLTVINDLNKTLFEPILFVSKDGEYPISSLVEQRVYVASPKGSNVLKSLPLLWRLLVHERPQIIWCVGPHVTGFAGRIFGFLLRTPVVIISLHGHHKNIIMDWPNRLITRLTTDQVVTTSQAFGKGLIAEGIPQPLIKIIYNGIDTDRFTPTSDRGSYKERLLKTAANRPVIGTVGNLLPVKAQNVLLTAAQQVLKSFPDTLFILVGEGISRAKLEQCARELGIIDSVLFLGLRTDVADLLRAFDIFVLTSNDESFGNVIIEAMASGLPVVSTAVGGIPEIVTDKTGILVTAGSHAEVSDAILELLANPERRNELGQNGRQRTISHFSKQAMVKAREQLFIDLLSKKGLYPARSDKTP